MDQMVTAPAVLTDLGVRYAHVRAYTERLAEPLTAEDQCIQSMPDASPAKWHRAHTTWFFEEFILGTYAPAYRSPNPAFRFLFNSYYETVGARQPRFARGMITRPSVDEVGVYRRHVDAAMADLIAGGAVPAGLVILGLQHEQQHQELLLTDMLHGFAQNPMKPAAVPGWIDEPGAAGRETFIGIDGGMIEIGHAGSGFCFDNETPRHTVLLRPYRISDRLVTNAAWLDFMADGGYRTPTLWMSDGWAAAQTGDWDAPLYWQRTDEGWMHFGPGGLAPLNPAAPVRHVSWYEADAFARWSGARLPTEFEFEHASISAGLHELTDRVWQWTDSAYRPYPAFAPVAGAIGEYNGKFMINQMVLRGGSVATPPGHARPTYRNFFHPDKRWQFTGVRLAKEA